MSAATVDIEAKIAAYRAAGKHALADVAERGLVSVPTGAGEGDDERPPRAGARSGVAGFEDLRATDMASAAETMKARLKFFAEHPNAGIEPTGLPELDKLVDFVAGRLYLLAARPGQGKSALALQLARYWSHRGPVLYVLTEMSLEETIERMVAAAAHVELWQVRRAVKPELRQAVDDALDWLAAEANLTVVEAAGVPADKLFARIRAWAGAQSDLPRAVILDNLSGITTASSRANGTGELANVVTRVIQSCYELSGDSGVACPVVVVHHLNRDHMAGGRKRTPGAHNLAASDGIERHVDTVLLLDDDPEAAGGHDMEDLPAETAKVLYVAKNRGGPGNVSIQLTFHGAQQRFSDVSGSAKPYAKPDAANAEADAEYRKAVAELPKLGAI